MCEFLCIFHEYLFIEKVIHKLSTIYPQVKKRVMQNVDNFCTKEFTKSHIKSKMWIMWITLKKVIHKKNVVKSRVLKSYPQWKMSYPQVINNLSTVKNWEKLSTLGVIHILWITLISREKNMLNLDKCG